MATYHSKVYGIVQGVGFRPFVSRLATEFKIHGSVCNKGPYVEIYAQGATDNLTSFFKALEERPPERSAILRLETKELASGPNFHSFEIIDSAKETGEIFVSPDIATCDKCSQELFDPQNRRYLHPFINCTACGPRITILDAMPYDRVRTSMREFPMCSECEKEYNDPATRRYDAQPICCNDCGPELYLLDAPDLRGTAALKKVRSCLRKGGIAAIKGIGGFHLACDAKNSRAVTRLRQLKHRPAKPFALMMRDIAAIEKYCLVDARQAELLTGHQKPILLLKRRKCSTLAPETAPGAHKIGVMLPYTPLHMLLFDYPDGMAFPDSLVMTSGNPSGAPICRTDEDARESLSGICDLILSHNRKIRLRADDSVMDWLEGQPYMIRRSRGYAPLPLMLSGNFSKDAAVLGIGGELKNTFCLGRGNLLYPSPYIGDMSDLRTVEALRESIERMSALLETKPKMVACDLHPRYNTTAVAKELNIPLFAVQHHYAHILSCLAENDWQEPAIGISFDGTGYGTDGTIWGGEVIKADYLGFERLGHICPFLQTGGDKASKEGWRAAIAILYGLTKSQAKVQALNEKLHLCTEKELASQFLMADKHMNSIKSTSAGRLFDAVSALLGIRMASTYEGEAAMYLEYVAESYENRFCTELRMDMAQCEMERSAIEPAVFEHAPFELPTEKLFAFLLAERLTEGADIEYLAFKFHAGLAAQITAACKLASEATGLSTVALSGGVFQNHLLMRLLLQALKKEGFNVLKHSLVPPNDGGLAIGQAAAALYLLKNAKA